MSLRSTRLIIVQLVAFLPAAAAFAADAPAPEKKAVEVANTTVKFNMVKLPAGSIEIKLGSLPARKVELKSFWIAETEVTWDEYDTFAYGLDIQDEKEKIDSVGKTRPSKPYGAPDFGFGHAGYPCLADTYHAATMYCVWLSQRTGKKFRLPTEAEWEYACRAGGAPVALEKADLEKVAWFEDNSDEKSQDVKKKQPNAWGLYDMLGNALEWVVKDEQAMKADEEADKKAADEGKETKKAAAPVARGGSWKDPADKVNSSQRFYQTSAWNVTDPQNPKSQWWLADGKFISFRVVCEE